jgi:hypothetical protein
MRTSRPPVIAAWILDRFGATPETEAIAGDLIEQYQQGRSRWWYWREVIVAIFRGTWFEVRQHSPLLLIAIAMGWILDLTWHSVITPFEYSLIDRFVVLFAYFLGPFPNSPGQFAFVAFLVEAPLAVAIGWTAARFARRCRIPAVLGMAGSLLVVGLWPVWKYAQIVRPEYLSTVWPFLWRTLLLTVLVLFGGGLLTGSPKRSIRT